MVSDAGPIRFQGDEEMLVQARFHLVAPRHVVLYEMCATILSFCRNVWQSLNTKFSKQWGITLRSTDKILKHFWYTGKLFCLGKRGLFTQIVPTQFLLNCSSFYTKRDLALAYPDILFRLYYPLAPFFPSIPVSRLFRSVLNVWTNLRRLLVPLMKKNLKQSWLPAFWKKKRSKTHKRLKERYLTGRNRTRHANFREGPIFQATCNVKTGIQTINFNLSCVSWMWEVGRRKRARDWPYPLMKNSTRSLPRIHLLSWTPYPTSVAAFRVSAAVHAKDKVKVTLPAAAVGLPSLMLSDRQVVDAC